MPGQPTIDLHYWPTPNGRKVTILLEETGIPYRIVPVNILKGDQFEPEFLKLNPNHRIPAMVDHAPAGGGAPITVFESGAILIYLAEKSGRFLPAEPHGRYAVIQWLMWQMANFGAKIGEFNHFNRLDAGAGDQSYALRRYGDEANRLYGVLNRGLYDNPYLGSDAFSIADIAVYPWASNWRLHGQDLDAFRHVGRWLEQVGARPGVQRGMDARKDLSVDPATLTEKEKASLRQMLFNRRAIPTPDEARR